MASNKRNQMKRSFRAKKNMVTLTRFFFLTTCKSSNAKKIYLFQLSIVQKSSHAISKFVRRFFLGFSLDTLLWWKEKLFEILINKKFILTMNFGFSRPSGLLSTLNFIFCVFKCICVYLWHVFPAVNQRVLVYLHLFANGQHLCIWTICVSLEENKFKWIWKLLKGSNLNPWCINLIKFVLLFDL